MVVTLVTPKMAEEWLEKNANNRPLANAAVNRYVHYIKTGQWRVNGEPLILDPDENLLNGQHRCNAIVKAEMAIPMVVIIGIDRDAFLTLDQGKIRSAADTLSVIGEEKARALASALSWLNRYETNTIDYRGPRLSNVEIVQLLNEFPRIKESMAYVLPRIQKGIHAPGPWTFLHYICTSRHPEHEAFFDQVLKGADLKQDSPAHRLTRKLTVMAKQPGKTQAQMVQVIALTIKAFNATVKRRNIGQLHWTPEEDFPTVVE